MTAGTVAVEQVAEAVADAVAEALTSASVAYSHATLSDMSTASRSWKVHDACQGNPFDKGEWLGEFDNKADAHAFVAKVRRERAVEAARHRLAAASAQPGVVEGDVLNEWTVDEVREAVRKSVDAPGSGHNVFARSHGISSSKLSEFLSGKRGAEPYIVEPCGFRWALVSANDYPRREDNVEAMLAASPPLSTRQGEAVREAAARIVEEYPSMEWADIAPIRALAAAIRAMDLPTIASEDRGEVERLREALKPFADAASAYPDDQADEWSDRRFDAAPNGLTVGDYRRAAKVLSPNAITDDGARGASDV